MDSSKGRGLTIIGLVIAGLIIGIGPFKGLNSCINRNEDQESTTFSDTNGEPAFCGSSDIAVSVSAECQGFGGSLCSCKCYKGYKVAGTDRYHGNCTNYAGGHICGHGPAEHGLSE
jgi:hypothetical protein